MCQEVMDGMHYEYAYILCNLVLLSHQQVLLLKAEVGGWLQYEKNMYHAHTYNHLQYYNGVDTANLETCTRTLDQISLLNAQACKNYTSIHRFLNCVLNTSELAVPHYVIWHLRKKFPSICKVPCSSISYLIAHKLTCNDDSM